MDIPRGNKCVAISDLGVHYTWKNIKMPYKNNKFKILGTIWTEEFELLDGSCSVSEI